ncbi:MAG: hypothetical protein IJH00_03100 [Erysipelotrichaceae bacterium]|nr:hypothetical protein [Erysipelotrichaceae bacterium]
MSELRDFKCPNCSGALEFDTKSQKLKCPYCDGTFDPEVFNEGTDFTVNNEEWNDDNIIVYSCRSCGGAIMADRDTAATSCPYCGNPVVMTSNVSGVFKPKKIIPFKLDKKQAKERYKKHLLNKYLLPDAFTSEAAIDEIKGVYVPYWLFDGRANARMWFDATRVRFYTEGDYDCTETSYYKLFRAGSVRFLDVPVDASSKIPDELTQSVEPYDNAESKDFNTSYLAGYVADKYDVDVAESRDIANSRISNSTSALFSSTTMGYDSVIPTSSSIAITEGNQEYVMYPMWLLNVDYNGKKYTFAMNGQTGKFVGDLPSDNGKLIKAMALVFFGITILGSLIQFILTRL